jgi:hypothetical protein
VITPEQLETVSAHEDPTAVLGLHANGEIAILTDVDDITPLQLPAADPGYLCRVETVRNLIAARGTQGACDQINRLLPAPAPQTEET